MWNEGYPYFSGLKNDILFVILKSGTLRRFGAFSDSARFENILFVRESFATIPHRRCPRAE
jgi:hypothetical protein